MDWGKKWLVDFNAGKTQLVLFDRFNNTGAIDMKMDASVLEEKSYFKGCIHYIFASFFLNLNESTCQTGKNVFYFTSKALFVLEKIKSNFMTSSNA